MRLSDWLDLCAHISALWPNDPVPPDTAQAWYPLLDDLDAAQVAVAVRTLRLDPTQRWAPTPGLIRQTVGTDEPSWADAIPEILRRLRRSDRTGDDRVARYIATLGDLGRLEWDPGDTTTRAQLRDWWNDDLKRQRRHDSQQIALASAAASPAIGRNAT